MLKARYVSVNNKNASLWQGYLQGIKRGCAAPSPEYIRESMVGHSIKLGTAADTDDDLYVSHDGKFDKIFSNFRSGPARLLDATRSASFETKRSDGGARSYLRDVFGGLCPDDLLGMYEYSPGVVCERRGFDITGIMPSVVDAAMDSPTDVMVAGILEPLKVRLITKGNSERYWVSRFYQKALWNHLQQWPQFALTGRPDQTNDLQGILERERSLAITDFNSWVSGDYSAATDGLKIQYTKAAMESSLLKNRSSLRPDVESVLRSVLYEQQIHYPSKYGLDAFAQKTGQLMGSTLSFPFLCVINLTCYWLALEEFLERSVPLELLPVLINGDDILFRTNDAFYIVWQRHITEVGFSLSLGKNYVHPRYLTINSHLYRHNHIDGTFEELNFLNVGLLTGQSKISGREKLRMLPLRDIYARSVGKAMNPVHAHMRFLYHHRKDIVRQTTVEKGTTINLFLPAQRGGLGLVPPPGVIPRYTSFQRRLAKFLESRYIESVAKKRIPKIEVGLGSELIAEYYSLRDKPRLAIIKKGFGPMEQRHSLYEPKNIPFAPLQFHADPERPDQVVKHPSSGLLKLFRKKVVPMLYRGKMHDWPYALVRERIFV